jgi:hypothetical protein
MVPSEVHPESFLGTQNHSIQIEFCELTFIQQPNPTVEEFTGALERRVSYRRRSAMRHRERASSRAPGRSGQIQCNSTRWTFAVIDSIHGASVFPWP